MDEEFKESGNDEDANEHNFNMEQEAIDSLLTIENHGDDQVNNNILEEETKCVESNGEAKFHIRSEDQEHGVNNALRMGKSHKYKDIIEIHDSTKFDEEKYVLVKDNDTNTSENKRI